MPAVGRLWPSDNDDDDEDEDECHLALLDEDQDEDDEENEAEHGEQEEEGALWRSSAKCSWLCLGFQTWKQLNFEDILSDIDLRWKPPRDQNNPGFDQVPSQSHRGHRL